MKKKYYLTAALPYASGLPHIGNVYEMVLADVIARFKRLDNFDVFFQLGTDDHGQKVAKKALSINQKPQIFTNNIALKSQLIYKQMNISYDNFIRTSDIKHKKIVQNIFEKLLKQNDIYLGKYEGWYSESEEAFVLEKDLIDGKTILGEKPIWTSEEAFFFKISKYQKIILKHIEENNFLFPLVRKKEIINNFFRKPIPDLCVSRTSCDWGISIKSFPKHKIYVWIDALSNYLTGIDFNLDSSSESTFFNKMWPVDLQIVGKDILRFHAIYFPALLLALKIPLPKRLFGHPWLITNQQKMSKSKGNVVYTEQLLNLFSADAIRFFLIKDIPYSSDGNINSDLIKIRYNQELVNNLGNLIQRTIAMIYKFQNGKIFLSKKKYDLIDNLEKNCLLLLPFIREKINDVKLGEALNEIMSLIKKANKYIENNQPWKLFKEKKYDHLAFFNAHLIESIRFIAISLQPFLPIISKKILTLLNASIISFSSLEKFNIKNTKKIENIKDIFLKKYD